MRRIIFCASVMILGGMICCGPAEPPVDSRLEEFAYVAGLEADIIPYENIAKGIAPTEFREKTGAPYKPSYNEDPAIPPQCWIETGYGTQNACQYCHTNYLAEEKHGNAFPLGEDQILYSFPSPNLNRVNWRNIIHPQEIIERLQQEGLTIPQPTDPGNLEYVATDNWREAYRRSRPDGDESWDNVSCPDKRFQLFPALDPDNLFPYEASSPTGNGSHGYIDQEGFVRRRDNGYTGWRAVNFFPYALFTPLTGSVSGIYIRLSHEFMTLDGKPDLEIYKRNLDLVETNIKNLNMVRKTYLGDARHIPIKKGFYPVQTEFAHPLHYVDLRADGEMGKELNGVAPGGDVDFEFPGTRSKRVKEIRYMVKWKDVGLSDIGEPELEFPSVVGWEGHGWIDNDAGWILAAFIEDRRGRLRPQTTEELLQCLGCHSHVGNTIDAVWSFQRKLPDELGWREMDYGEYRESSPGLTRLRDYFNAKNKTGEMEYFFSSVVGADLFGVMPAEIKAELVRHAEERDLRRELGCRYSLDEIFDDDGLKTAPRAEREVVLRERAAIMRHYARSRAYLYRCERTDQDFIKGGVFYPSEKTMRSNIAGYRRIVLDQSFNLGKNVFGSQPDAVPFTFRSDGSVENGEGRIIPSGEIIESRPWDEDGIGKTPTGIVRVNAEGEPVDDLGRVVDIDSEPEKAEGHVSRGGTFETRYSPIIGGKAVIRKK